jgi:DNA anti-recombination protein RmuC
MREILTTLSERQLAEQSRHTAQVLQSQADQTGRMSADVGKAIAEHLGGPITEIANAVKGVSTNQGEAVNKMLTDVLAGFSAQMQDMFGGQMRGMTDLLKETSEAMKSSAEKFAKLATDMDDAGKGTVEAMGERLNHAITSMEARQQIMNRQTGEFVAQIRTLVAESQTESSRKLQQSLEQVGGQVASVIEELRRQAEEAAESQGHRESRFAESTGNVVKKLSEQMEALLTQSIEMNRSLQDTVARLSEATGNAIAGMKEGAETLFVAASDFAKAGQGVTETMRASADATGNIKAASATLVASTSATKDVLADYGRTRDSFAAMVAELKFVTENASRDAAMTSEIVARIEAAAQKLAVVQRQSEDYLHGVNEVLTKTHEAFSENVVRTLREGNRQFQDELRTAVDMVSAAVRDLGDTLEDVPGRER